MLQEERQIQELKQLQREMGKAGASAGPERVDFLYEQPQTKKEEYLLGKPIDIKPEESDIKKVDHLPGSNFLNGQNNLSSAASALQLAPCRLALNSGCPRSLSRSHYLALPHSRSLTCSHSLTPTHSRSLTLSHSHPLTLSHWPCWSLAVALAHLSPLTPPLHPTRIWRNTVTLDPARPPTRV